MNDWMCLYILCLSIYCACSITWLCPTLWPHGLKPTRSSVHGIPQARTLEWVAVSSSRGSSWPRDRASVSGIAGSVLHCRIVTTAKNCYQSKEKVGDRRPIKENHSCSHKKLHGACYTLTVCVLCLVSQSCRILCNPMDCSPPGPSVMGILQARILGWGCHGLLHGIFPTQGLNSGLPHCRWILYPLSHQTHNS